MEAIAGLSLAANILQIVDFTTNVLSTGNQIRQSGSTVQNSDLEQVVHDLTALSERIMSWARPNPASTGPLAKDSQALEDLASKCMDVAQELIAVLESLRCSKDATRSKSILSALRTTWSAKKIEEIKSRLQLIRDELQFRILISIRDDQLRGLDKPSRKALHSIVESNEEVLSTTISETGRIMERQDADSLLASTRHDEVLCAISKRPKEEPGNKNVPRAIANKLYFARKDDRYDDIVFAHRDTFNWALESRDSISWPSLVDWLREEGGVYWISGKAGSGKSTLMKYLYQDSRFMDSLKLWAGGDRLIVADFYFWSSGAEIQKSQAGLLRSLLWQVIDQDVSLAHTLFAEQYLPDAEWDEFPTFHQLRRAFRRLTTHSLTSTKIAIVVDGLDEFDTRRITMTELGEMLIAATRGGNIKALLSSRPLTEFMDCFAGRPQLQLQQLTHNDITTYVYDTLSVHSQMVYLKATYKDETKALVQEIVTAASGVFLWVKLVVRSLLQGLQNGDKIEDLQLRLWALPQDLEALFTHMLDNVPLLYKPQAACIFQILRCNNQGHQQPVSVRGGTRPLTAVRLFHAEAVIEDVISADVSPLSEEELRNIEITTERRLRSRCAGLLELRTRVMPDREYMRWDKTGELGKRRWKDVVYLHRTVADFLHKREVWDHLVSHSEGLKFNPYLAVLQSLVMEVKVVRFGQQRPGDYTIPWQLVIETLLFARLAEAKTKTSSRKLLDELDRVMTTYFPDVTGRWKEGEYKNATWCDTWNEGDGRTAPCHDNFMSLTVKFGLTLYVQDTIRAKGQSCLNKLGRPLLDYTCRLDTTYGDWSEMVDPNLIQTLLLHGADPNVKFNGFSAWENCLRMGMNNSVKWVTMLRILLLHGANTNACVETGQGRKTGLIIIQEYFDEFLTGDAQAIENMEARLGYPEATAITGQSSAGILAQLKLDVVELKRLFIKGQSEGVQSKVGNGDSRIFGERVTLHVRRLFGRGHK